MASANSKILAGVITATATNKQAVAKVLATAAKLAEEDAKAEMMAAKQAERKASQDAKSAKKAEKEAKLLVDAKERMASGKKLTKPMEHAIEEEAKRVAAEEEAKRVAAEEEAKRVAAEASKPLSSRDLWLTCLSRISVMVGHRLSNEEERSFSTFVGRGSGVTHWDTTRLREKVDAWQASRT